MSDDAASYDLVMPFLPVQSRGGPFDDQAFTAGYQMGLLDAQLGKTEFDQGRPINVHCREQADLIAMRHGFVAEFTDEEINGWACVTLTAEGDDE